MDEEKGRNNKGIFTVAILYTALISHVIPAQDLHILNFIVNGVLCYLNSKASSLLITTGFIMDYIVVLILYTICWIHTTIECKSV